MSYGKCPRCDHATFGKCAHCKHCDLKIVDKGVGWIHVEGEQTSKHRCALEPYGYDAAPHYEECSFTCRGYTAPEAVKA
jgi:hypothetical protein